MYSSSMSLGPGGVDVLGNLTSKMVQQLKDTENIRTLFGEDVQKYKDNQIGKKEFVHKVVNYTISLSALNFLVMHVILEMRTALEKGSSMKDSTGGTVMEDSTGPNSQFSFGIQGFLGSSSHDRSGDGGEILNSGIGHSVSPPNNAHTVVKANRSYDRMALQKGQGNSREFPELRLVQKHCASCGTFLL